jgi:P pilus assembly chaperone PapD
MNFSDITVNGKSVPEAWFVAPFSTIKIPVATHLHQGKRKSHGA